MVGFFLSHFFFHTRVTSSLSCFISRYKYDGRAVDGQERLPEDPLVFDFQLQHDTPARGWRDCRSEGGIVSLFDVVDLFCILCWSVSQPFCYW